MRWKSRSLPAFSPHPNLDEDTWTRDNTRKEEFIVPGSRLKGESFLGISINEEFTLRVVPPVRCMHVPLPNSSPLAFLFGAATENIAGRLAGAIREPPLEIVRHCGKILSFFFGRDRARDILERSQELELFFGVIGRSGEIRAVVGIRRNHKFPYAGFL